MSIADEIEKLNNLRQEGAITEEEYLKAKESLLKTGQSAGEKPSGEVGKLPSDVNTWCMLIHLSQFCGYLIPLAGMIVPIVLWQMKKKQSDLIDTHGRIVVNWLITEVIFAVAFVLLCLVLIGIPLLIALGVVGIVFPIVGGVKANNGEVWPYPCSIRFFRTD